DQPEKPATAGGKPAASSAAGTSGKAKPKSDAGGMDSFFGRKGLERVLAEKNVRTVERQEEPDHALRYQMEIYGDNLTYAVSPSAAPPTGSQKPADEGRKAYIWGPGRLRILSHDKPKAGAPALPGLAPNQVDAAWTGDVPDGYSRTQVVWTESMAYDVTAERAYFKGNVETRHVGRGLPGSGATDRRRAPSLTRITSAELQVAFAEKSQLPDAATSSKSAAAPTVRPAAASAQATGGMSAAPREDRMTVEKIVADGGVNLWIDDRRGLCERLIYQREPERLRLYRGTEDWARLWRENEASQEFDEIVARVITYEPTSGRVEVIDQQSITVSPRPKSTATGKAAKP
ncbi:MAG: hypothetical protein NTU94_07645, partial [Planctomycetota bacterium]|nr:hypothetical protein [Planctomycetota bacterium]